MLKMKYHKTFPLPKPCLTLLFVSVISPKGEIEVKDVTVENFINWI